MALTDMIGASAFSINYLSCSKQTFQPRKLILKMNHMSCLRSSNYSTYLDFSNDLKCLMSLKAKIWK